MKKIMTFRNLEFYEINEINIVVIENNKIIKTFNHNKCDLIDCLYYIDYINYIENINNDNDTLYIDNDYSFIIDTLEEENINIKYQLKDL